MLELRNYALHATRLYPLLLWLLDKHLSATVLHMQFCLPTLALVALGNFGNEAADKATFFVENGGLVLSRRNVNRWVFGKEIGWFELDLMRLNWHYREICPTLAE